MTNPFPVARLLEGKAIRLPLVLVLLAFSEVVAALMAAPEQSIV
jgi:hypothetical protein